MSLVTDLLPPTLRSGPLCALVLFGCLPCWSCTPEGPDGSASPRPGLEASGKPPGAPHKRLYGAPLTPQPLSDLSRILAEPKRYAAKTVTVEGLVSRVCSRKGCWMEIAKSSRPSPPACRVTFKDYGFFVPTNSAGQTAKLQGEVRLDTIEPDRVDHLESEGGRFPEKNPDGSVTEVRIVATGVELADG